MSDWWSRLMRFLFRTKFGVGPLISTSPEYDELTRLLNEKLQRKKHKTLEEAEVELRKAIFDLAVSLDIDPKELQKTVKVIPPHE